VKEAVMVSRDGWALLVVVCLLVMIGTTSPLFGQSMKIVVATVPLPTEGEEVSLPGLRYGHPWRTELTSIRWVVDKEESDRIRVLWTLSGSNGRARPQRVRIEINVLDDSGETVAAVVRTVILKHSTKDQKIKIKMKASLQKWTRGESLRIMGNFFIGS